MCGQIALPPALEVHEQELEQYPLPLLSVVSNAKPQLTAKNVTHNHAQLIASCQYGPNGANVIRHAEEE